MNWKKIAIWAISIYLMTAIVVFALFVAEFFTVGKGKDRSQPQVIITESHSNTSPKSADTTQKK